MRVTNAMLSNNMMLGLNKNMNQLNKLYDQMNSLKKIQRPSDDPIILGRSLKLRLNVLETEQYKTNVGEAKSWMEISENAIDNTHEIFKDIRHQAVQASNGPLGTDDRQKILETVKQLKSQLVQESNANYAGRNVFGGYKTDEKVLFDKKVEKHVEFEQTFTKKDLEVVTYREEEYYRIRLPYGDIDGDVTIDGAVVSSGNSTDAPPVLTPPDVGGSHYHPDDMHFMKDTGELIISKEKYDEMMRGNPAEIIIGYEKTSFKEGDPNPELFFELTSLGDPDAVPPVRPVYGNAKLSQKIEYEIGIGTKLDINVLGKDLFDPLSLRDIDEMIYILEGYNKVEKELKGEFDDPTYTGPERDVKETINLSKLFSNGIGKMDKALKSVSGQQADLGSRIKRLDLTEKRLGDDEISYTDLLSRTEDVELERAFIDFNTQYAVYQSALQVTAKVVQPTLMDFLR